MNKLLINTIRLSRVRFLDSVNLDFRNSAESKPEIKPFTYQRKFYFYLHSGVDFRVLQTQLEFIL